MIDSMKSGILLNEKDIKRHRQYFREMVKLIGIYVLYRAPLKDKHYTVYAELDSNYEPPIQVGCIFDTHPTQQTLRKIGWVSELQEESSLIHVDYDLPGLQQGALFIIPSGLDDGKGRIFRVVRLQNSMVYPSTMVCEIVPQYENTFEPETNYDFEDTDFHLLNDEDPQVLFEK